MSLYELDPTAAVPSPTIAADRDRVAQALSLHFAADHLRMDELERRVAHVYRAQTRADAESVLVGLPMLSPDTLDAGMVSMVVPSDRAAPRGIMFAVLGGASRKGSWIMPRHLKVFAMMGGAEIDLREARFAPGVSEIDVIAFMGGVEITVPRGVRVEVLGAAIMGGFAAEAGDASALDEAQPVLRVTGLAVMAGVDVRVRQPGKKTLARFEEAVNATRTLVPGEPPLVIPAKAGIP